jgi:flavin reductase (DIM6/NTAB) family NADH-FMN oxidoreductase RutF
MPAEARYRLLVSTVVPRPIAWVVSRAPGTGVVNAAPYSFFNVMGADPPVVAIGVMARGDGYKDTARNILDTGEFVVCLVPEALAGAMNATCVDAPPEMGELQMADIATAPSLRVAPPRIAASPVALECVTLHALELGPRQVCVLGRVVRMHVASHLLSGDPARPRVDTAAMGLIGRMHGSGLYARTGDLFELQRPSWPPA